LIECQERERREREAFEREKAENHAAKHEDEECRRRYQERKKHRELSDQTIESERIKAEKVRCDSVMNDCLGPPAIESEESAEPGTSDKDSVPLGLEENASGFCHGRFFRISRTGARIFLNPLNAEFDRTTPLSNSINVTYRVMELATQSEDIGKGLLADLVGNCTPCESLGHDQSLTGLTF
jgi:hypothetical protein